MRFGSLNKVGGVSERRMSAHRLWRGAAGGLLPTDETLSELSLAPNATLHLCDLDA